MEDLLTKKTCITFLFDIKSSVESVCIVLRNRGKLTEGEVKRGDNKCGLELITTTEHYECQVCMCEWKSSIGCARP